jgi:hypothetical protein
MASEHLPDNAGSDSREWATKKRAEKPRNDTPEGGWSIGPILPTAADTYVPPSLLGEILRGARMMTMTVYYTDVEEEEPS